jgi:hypothetical protein
LADFTYKVTSKELFNRNIKGIICVTLFEMVTGFPFVSVLKVKKIPHAKSKKSAKIIMYCRRLSDTFLQLAKGTLISFWAVAKGYLLPFGSLCMRNPRIVCTADHVLQYTAQRN